MWNEMTSVQHLMNLQNLVCLKLDGCSAAFALAVLYSKGNPSIKELSFRRCILGYPHHYDPHDFSIRRWRLKLFDCSETHDKIPRRFHQIVLNDPECPTTHVYFEKCFVYSDRIPDHSKIKHVSLAGCKAQNSDVLFDVIDQWASHHVIETINASGCTLTESQREELLRKHKNVSFNLNKKFEESVRVKL